MKEELKVIENQRVEITKTDTVDGPIHLATLKSNLAHFEEKVTEIKAKIKQLEDAGIEAA
jgi:hypothetical protein